MVIYTPLTLKEVRPLLTNFPIGYPEKLTPLDGGTTNSNFRVTTPSGDYVLTLLEPAEEAAQIPWLKNYLSYLNKKGIPVPALLETPEGNTVVSIKGKNAIIAPFFKGHEASPDADTSFKAGALLANMNILSQDYDHTSPPPWGLDGLKQKRQQVEERRLSREQSRALDVFDETYAELQASLHNVPKGVVHSDLFPDNVLFSGGDISAVIDFYKAGQDALAYDLAMGLAAWGFKENGEFNNTAFQGFYQGYTSQRPLNSAEHTALPQLLNRACATIILMRILRGQFLRSQDRAKNAITPRSPTDYLRRLEFLNRNNLQALLNG